MQARETADLCWGYDTKQNNVRREPKEKVPHDSSSTLGLERKISLVGRSLRNHERVTT
jgi:hypothetical protein